MSLYLSGKPFRRGFNCDDTSIRYPFRDSTISSKVLQLYCLGIPIITIAVVEFIRYSKNVRLFSGGSPRQLREFSWILYNEVIVFIFGALCSQFLTDIAKYSIGRLRPHFLDVCRPKDLDGRLCGRNDFRYIEDYECTQSNGELLKDARLSFMSGHSSLSAYAMVFTAVSVIIYLCHGFTCQTNVTVVCFLLPVFLGDRFTFSTKLNGRHCPFSVRSFKCH